MKGDTDSIFLDTSIVIARLVHQPATKKRIRERLSKYDQSVTSLVVKQEFKRRLLKEAQYLLNQLNDKKSFAVVHRHIVDILPPQQARKRNICMEMLSTIFEGAKDPELTERAKRYLRQLLRVGLKDLDRSVDSLVWQLGCACAGYPVEEKVPYRRYEFGPEKCRRVAARCGVISFFEDHLDAVRDILKTLQSIPAGDKSAELNEAERFIDRAVADPSSICTMDPCLRVGDLLIALESLSVESFYTMNGKESQHLCRALNQTLIVRPKNPEHEDVLCQSSAAKWPAF